MRQLLSADALAGRTVFVTGVSGGIGSVTARTLVSAGATIVAHYLDDLPQAEAVFAGLAASQVELVSGDLATASGARELWRAASSMAEIDTLVLNAAVMPYTPIDGPDEQWDAGWQTALQVNVIGSGTLMREAVRSFAERGSGAVIVFSSWAAQQGSRIRDVSAYAASKAAIRNLGQTLARSYARHGVRIYVVAPGVVRAGMGLVGQDSATQRAVAEGLAMGRYVEPEEVANVVAFLAADGSPSLTGSTVDINGASYIR